MNLDITQLKPAQIGTSEIATKYDISQAVATANKTYAQNDAPTSGMIVGDTWVDTNDSNKLYTYTPAGWKEAGGGSQTFLQTTAPVSGMNIGDIWFDSDDGYKQYRYNGTTWGSVQDVSIAAAKTAADNAMTAAGDPVSVINNGTTTINGSKITTGSITADHISTAGLTAGVIKSGVLYNTGGTAASYTMKIDLDNGLIHIK